MALKRKAEIQPQIGGVIPSHYSNKIIVMELYAEFVKADGAHPSSATVTTNVGTEVEAESPITQLCGG
ncbi:hypothetical protein J1N35_014928 [Gossypium stocksii]|uniref:Uncharacterized protein n=1 Tax=Gossypium stocksii TaxID=47602 RepID=A0A9D3VVK4_9ROSI|nr:hypothetical protein J1N35_014928 [Gossypium stocksii]